MQGPRGAAAGAASFCSGKVKFGEVVAGVDVSLDKLSVTFAVGPAGLGRADKVVSCGEFEPVGAHAADALVRCCLNDVGEGGPLVSEFAFFSCKPDAAVDAVLVERVVEVVGLVLGELSLLMRLELRVGETDAEGSGVKRCFLFLEASCVAAPRSCCFVGDGVIGVFAGPAARAFEEEVRRLVPGNELPVAVENVWARLGDVDRRFMAAILLPGVIRRLAGAG